MASAVKAATNGSDDTSTRVLADLKTTAGRPAQALRAAAGSWELEAGIVGLADPQRASRLGRQENREGSRERGFSGHASGRQHGHQHPVDPGGDPGLDFTKG